MSRLPTTFFTTVVAALLLILLAAPAPALARAPSADYASFTRDLAPWMLERRSTSCSNGIKVSCPDSAASISCSGQCTACCGNCCQTYPLPESNSCGSSTPQVSPSCGTSTSPSPSPSPSPTSTSTAPVSSSSSSSSSGFGNTAQSLRQQLLNLLRQLGIHF